MKIKKFSCAILALILLFSTSVVAQFSVNAVEISEQDSSVSGELKYTVLSDGTAKIISYYTTATSYSVPETINDHVVSAIGDDAFWGCSRLQSVTIPENVKSIGSSAFEGCTKLAEINVTDSLTKIGERTFYNTAFYNNADNWQDNALYLGNHLIRVRTSAEGRFEIKKGTLTTADYTFENCKSLTEISIPDTVKIIGADTFASCQSLTGLTIPDSVTSIGTSAFYECKSLETMVIPESITEIKAGTFTD